jgi:hypothetical protein
MVPPSPIAALTADGGSWVKDGGSWVKDGGSWVKLGAKLLRSRPGRPRCRLTHTQILQLGTLAMIPYIGQLILEMGIVKAFVMVLQQILTGSLFFYMFQQQTVASSFIADMMYGSAKYVGTGRGFNISALDFVKVRAEARSQLLLGQGCYSIKLDLLSGL